MQHNKSKLKINFKTTCHISFEWSFHSLVNLSCIASCKCQTSFVNCTHFHTIFSMPECAKSHLQQSIITCSHWVIVSTQDYN